MQTHVTVLGCGASVGVPAVGCLCAVCASTNPKNKRRRVSLHVRRGDTSILIDAAPDLRAQLLDNPGIRHVDGVLFTHDHADHTHGIDDLRAFNRMQQKPLQIYADSHCLEGLQNRFAYAFRPVNTQHGWYKVTLESTEIQPFVPFEVGGVEVVAFPQEHGKMRSLGFRMGPVAYSTDLNGLSDEAFEALKGVEVWVVDAQGYSHALTHSNVEQTLEWIKRVNPKLAVLTHMGHELDYATLERELPEGVVPAFDNMHIACG